MQVAILRSPMFWVAGLITLFLAIGGLLVSLIDWPLWVSGALALPAILFGIVTCAAFVLHMARVRRALPRRVGSPRPFRFKKWLGIAAAVVAGIGLVWWLSSVISGAVAATILVAMVAVVMVAWILKRPAAANQTPAAQRPGTYHIPAHNPQRDAVAKLHEQKQYAGETATAFGVVVRLLWPWVLGIAFAIVCIVVFATNDPATGGSIAKAVGVWTEWGKEVVGIKTAPAPQPAEEEKSAEAAKPAAEASKVEAKKDEKKNGGNAAKAVKPPASTEVPLQPNLGLSDKKGLKSLPPVSKPQ